MIWQVCLATGQVASVFAITAQLHEIYNLHHPLSFLYNGLPCQSLVHHCPGANRARKLRRVSGHGATSWTPISAGGPNAAGPTAGQSSVTLNLLAPYIPRL